ncbi:MAG: amidohydrolase family protein [Oscillospiraceae bacterium]|jgi:predicted TIM-barrel fold metal-dependent hydrolase
MNKVDFEAHYYTDFFAGEFTELLSKGVPKFGPFADLLDLGGRRLENMDRHGIDTQIISLSVGLELLETSASVDVSRRVNDVLAEAAARYPGRFLGCAALPVNDTDAAVQELERCVLELGFVGWNTFSNFGGPTLADERYFPILRRAAELGVFVYLHPTVSAIDEFKGWGRDLEFGLGYHFDTCITLMKMIATGVFDRLPNLKVILGHLGEGWPFMRQRLDSKSVPAGQGAPPGMQGGGKNLKKCGEYWDTNIWATTSGNYSKPAFQCAKDVLGIDHLLLGTDYPYEDLGECMSFLQSIDLTNEERASLYYKNAEKIFGIKV